MNTSGLQAAVVLPTLADLSLLPLLCAFGAEEASDSIGGGGQKKNSNTYLSTVSGEVQAITGVGAGDSRGHGGFFYDRIILPLVLKRIYEDKDRQERLLRASEANWTIIRPGVLTNGARTGEYRVLTELVGVTLGHISREDVAHFMRSELERPLHERGIVNLCY